MLIDWIDCRSEELFYQLGLRQFGSLVRIKLSPPPPLRDLLRLAVDHADGVGATSLPSDEIVDVSSLPNTIPSRTS